LLHNRAQIYSNNTLHPLPVNRTLGLNERTGLITYNYEYNNRPAPSLAGVITENITLSWDLPNDYFAELVPFGRTTGPILQAIGTQTSSKLNVTIEALTSGTTQVYTAVKPDSNAIISGYVPSATWVFKNRDNETWSPLTGRYSRSIGWTYSS